MLSICLLGSATCSLSSAATIYIWDFSTPTGTLGTSQTYPSSPVGITLTAFGFLNNGTGTALYGKQGGVDENGLGFNLDGDHEINTSGFILVDLTNLKNAGTVTALSIIIDSVQSTESYDIYGSNVSGSLGTLLIGAGTSSDTSIVLSTTIPTNYQFLGVTAHSANILLTSMSATVEEGGGGGQLTPEPVSFLLVGTGLMGAYFLRRRPV
jgi:hypothetical protein